MRISRAIRASAWALVAAGVIAPALRRQIRLPPAGVICSAAVAPVALSVVVAPSRKRDVAVCVLTMWAYIAAYELPHDDAERQAQRVRIDYPIDADRLLGLGVVPTLRLQRRLSTPGSINRFERLLVFCHWVWFAVPHCTVAYVLVRAPERFPYAAARMYGVFGLGAVFYWAIPTAPPWYAALQGRLQDPRLPKIRRMMIEYGDQFWGERWPALYDVLGGNPLAAMPSLHFATSMMGARILSEVGPLAGAIGWTYAALLGLALVYLGEHYAVDLVGGAALAEAVRRGAPVVAPVGGRAVRALAALQRYASEDRRSALY